jgi:two-component system NtrC family sensor kinase
MKRPLQIIFLFLIPMLSLGQQKINVDSLIRVALSPKNNTRNMMSPNRDSLFEQLPFAKSPTERIRLIYEIIGYGVQNSKQGLKYHYKILDWARKNNDRIIEAVVSAELGFNFYDNGENTEGLKMDFAALKMAEKTGNGQAIGIAYGNLASCYYPVNISLQKFYWQKSLPYTHAGGQDLYYAYALDNLAYLANEENKKDSALYFELKCFEFSVRKNVPVLNSRSLVRLGDIETNDKLKLKYYKAGATIANIKRDTIELIFASTELASYYQLHGKPDSGIFYAKKAFRLSEKRSLIDKIDPAHLLIQLYKGRNADSTIKYTNIYYAARDSMYSISKNERAQEMAFTDQQREQEIAAQKQAYQTNLRMYLLTAVIAFLIVLAFVFWRNNRQKQKANHLLNEQKEEIESQRDNLHKAFRELKTTQTQLIQSEKMASLGELTAGIAHEIQNPLNFVNNFSEVNREMIDELKAELKGGNVEEALAIADDIGQNEDKINHHGKRADSIVKGMLEHSRSSSGQKEPTDLNVIADEYLRLSYHGLRSKDKSFNADIITMLDRNLPKINVIPQDIGRVLLNLFNNAFYAINQKMKTAGSGYKPEVSVTTSTGNGQVIIKVKDNGVGIPDGIKDKIMQPFFTTKPTGEGTGLGLSLTYDMVVKGHGGSIVVASKEGEGSEFTISLPIN